MAAILPHEMLDDELDAVVRAGGYGSQKDAMRHALEVLLAANAGLRISTAIELYRIGKVTLSRAAEIAQMEIESFKEKLEEKAVSIPVTESPDEIRLDAAALGRSRGDSDAR